MSDHWSSPVNSRSGSMFSVADMRTAGRRRSPVVAAPRSPKGCVSVSSRQTRTWVARGSPHLAGGLDLVASLRASGWNRPQTYRCAESPDLSSSPSSASTMQGFTNLVSDYADVMADWTSRLDCFSFAGLQWRTSSRCKALTRSSRPRNAS